MGGDGSGQANALAPPARDIEILVHVGAPSGAKDDARYRTQARTFLAAAAGNDWTQVGETVTAALEIRYGTAPGDAEGASIPPSAFRRATKHSVVPQADDLQASREVDQQLERINSSFSSESARSTSEPVVQVSRTTSCKKRGRPEEEGSSLGRRKSPRLATSNPGEQGRSPSRVRGSPCDTPCLPLSRRWAKPGKGGDRQRRPTARRIPSQDSTLYLSGSSTAPASACTSSLAQSQSSVVRVPSSPRLPLPPLSASLLPQGFEIHPAPPPTALAPISAFATTLLTPSLSLLASHLPLAKHYHSRLLHPPSRKLRELERGHWRFDTATYPAPLRTRFWAFLGDFVGSGKGGWGMWVSASPMSASATAGVEGEDGGGEHVRLYCWSGVVAYAWIVLLVASERKIRGTNTAWIDAGGAEVVTMR